MEREVGGGIGMGNTCKPLPVSFQCMTKSTTNKKKKKKKNMVEVESLNSVNTYLVCIFLTNKLSLAKINFTGITIKRYI